MSGTPTITALIPWRDWPAARLHECLRRLDAQTFPAHVVIGNTGDPRALSAHTLRANVNRRVTVANGPTAGPWNRALALNVAARAATTTHLLAIDADTLFAHPGVLADFAAESRDDPDALWLAECWDVRQREGAFRVGAPHGRQGMGGCALLPRALLEELRGWDEAYTHWGGEDTDLADRVRNYGLDVRWWEAASQHPLVWTWANDATCPDPLTTGEGIAARDANRARLKIGATLPLVRNPKTWAGKP